MGERDQVRDPRGDIVARLDAHGVRLLPDEIDVLVAAEVTLRTWDRLLESSEERSVEPATSFWVHQGRIVE